MDLTNIVQFRLFKKNLPSHNFDKRYWFKTISSADFSDNITHIETVIKYHHEDLDWNETPTKEIVHERLKFGSQCHLWMYENTCLGWHWTNNDCVTIDWKSYYQPLEKNEIYIGGALVSRLYKPHTNSSLFFYRQGFEYSFNLNNTNTMYLYSDDWNRASAILCYKNGFTKFNFIKENNGKT